MSNPNGQAGARWEAEVRSRLQGSEGWLADRHPKRGVKGEPDIWATVPHPPPGGAFPVLAWKRLTRNEAGARRRTPDGVRAVAVLEWESLVRLWEEAGRPPLQVQCKAAQQINVTRVLGRLISALKEIWWS